MNARYENLGMPPLATTLETSPRDFEKRLRDIEAGAPSLNLGSGTVHLAAEIAALEPNLDDARRIALVLLIVISMAALEEGSTRFPVSGAQAIGPMRRVLSSLCGSSFGVDGAEKMRLAIEQLLRSGSAESIIAHNATDYKPLIYLSPFIYHHRILAAEIALACRLASMMKADIRAIGQNTIRDLRSEVTTQEMRIRGEPVNLSDEQQAAVASAARSHLTIISGGPGTGKTSIVLAILRLLIRSGVPAGEIALAAPTGKAAYRIGEAVREASSRVDLHDDASLRGQLREPATVHRLLGYSPTLRRFRHDRNNPIAASAVIVDEGSMLDLDLLTHLLDAIRPDSRLVLLGDADQLPSVEAGAIFRELLSCAEENSPQLAGACVRLNRNYRVDTADARGRALSDLARAINSGDGDALAPLSGNSRTILVRRDSADEIEFSGAEWLEAKDYSAFLDRWYSEWLRGDEEVNELANRVYTIAENGFGSDECEAMRRLFGHAANHRILCVTKVFDSGADETNLRLHRLAAREAHGAANRAGLIAGEPVMVLRNDYDRMLFNGDQGLVLKVRRSGSNEALTAVFPRDGHFAAFRIDTLKEELELCYAMTIHKAQGSEFDSVAVALPEQDIPILTREMLYTAVSRARKSVTVVGAEAILRAGISRRVERYSGVGEQLAMFLNDSAGA